MSNKIVFKRSAVAGKIPALGDLALGEIALNTHDGCAYIRKDDGTPSIIQLGLSASDLTVLSNIFTGTGSQTDFILSRIPTTDEHVFITINGLIQETTTYSFVGSTLSFSTAPDLYDSIEVRVLYGNSSSVSLRDYKKYVYNILTTTTNITGSDSIGLTLAYDVGYVDVYQNGIRLISGDDFIASNGTSITLTLAALNGDTVEVISYGRAYILDNSNTVIANSVALTTIITNQVVDTFESSLYSTAKYIVQAKYNTSIHSTEIMVMHDGTNVYINEYGTMYSGASLGTFSTDIVLGIVRLLFSPTNINTTVKSKRIQISI
jgi:hypothetical protein